MKHAKLFSLVVMVLALCYGAAGFFSLPMTAFQGDLTRMGMLPESEFGWRKPQPAIDPSWLEQSSMQDADVLVIGDSFSIGGIWQTVLTRNGYRVRTEHWNSIRAICADVMPWLEAQGFHGKYIVLESIERNLADDLDRSAACEKMQYHPNVRTDAPRHPPAVTFEAHDGNYNGRLSTGFRTLLHAVQYGHLGRSADFSTWELPNDVTLARVENGCSLFSHASCNDALFLSYDLPGEVSPRALDHIALLNARMEGVTPIWMIVPNKSTVYRYPEKMFWNEAAHRFTAPNLLESMVRAVNAGMVDLYPANNTHVSTQGYLLMGDEMLRTLQAGNAKHPR